MIGLDTSAIIDLFRGNENIGKVLANMDEPVAVTRVSYLELMFGLDADNAKHALEEKYYTGLFTEITVIELDERACKEASKIHFSLKKKGVTIGGFDCAIAGTFMAQGVDRILTRNTKHFGKIAGLKAIEY